VEVKMASEKKMSAEEVKELLKHAEAQLDIVSNKLNEMLPRTRRKRAKKVKVDGPILSEDMGVESESEN
jgi:hypothetical protein